MAFPALLRRREIWLPTLWGWAAILLVFGALLAAVFRMVHPFLAISEPVGARVLVVEGWMGPEELDEALATFRSRGYERLITTGGPIFRSPPAPGPATFAEQAADYLKRRGAEPAAVIAVPAAYVSENRTFTSAVALREWASRSHQELHALDVITDGAHARRSRMLYELAFGPEVEIGVLATRTYDYNAGRWWRSSIGVKRVIEELVGIAWTECCWAGSNPRLPHGSGFNLGTGV